MARTVKTMNLSGSEYAKVPERLKVFWGECPKGAIETAPMIQPDGSIIFKATVTKDKSDPTSKSATGHSLGTNKKAKDFEKLETIAVGRALAMLGYLASGEIASSEEMEEFIAFQEEKLDRVVEELQACKTLDELKAMFLALGPLMAESKIIEAKDKRKAELTQ